jgi:hypothetical protein
LYALGQADIIYANSAFRSLNPTEQSSWWGQSILFFQQLGTWGNKGWSQFKGHG